MNVSVPLVGSGGLSHGAISRAMTPRRGPVTRLFAKILKPCTLRASKQAFPLGHTASTALGRRRCIFLFFAYAGQGDQIAFHTSQVL